ncbi:MAG: hypothetical protein GY801_14915, partial [bacterium]|nr:hypothetical protein [bacterium]
VRLFTIPFDPKQELFQDEELRAFLLNKQIKTLRPEFFQANGKAYWSIFAEYENVFSTDIEKSDGLNEPQKLLFQRLREWRKETANKEGIPVFIIANNSQLAEVVLRDPKTLESLRQIHGFGKKKVDKYGKEILGMIETFYEKKPERAKASHQ